MTEEGNDEHPSEELLGGGASMNSSEGTDHGTGGGQMNGMGGVGGMGGEDNSLDGYGDGTQAGATRANGLTAAYYVPLRDVDPRVGVELLTKLGAAGIAAYVAPTPGLQGGGFPNVRPPALPTDRLWVDGAQRSEAEAVIAGVVSDDEIFEQLVAMFHTSSPAEAPWPVSEELSSPTPRSPQTWTTRRSITARQAQPPPEEPAQPALPEAVEHYLDEHFVPEPPPPLPRPQGITVLAWALIGLGVLMIVFHNSLPIDFQQGSNVLAVFALLSGFATLVYRMHDSGRDDDNDGAVV